MKSLGPTAFTVHAARSAGPVAMMKAAKLAVETARQYGVAIALVHDLTLVTRNVADFEGSGVKLANPFQ